MQPDEVAPGGALMGTWRTRQLARQRKASRRSRITFALHKIQKRECVMQRNRELREERGRIAREMQELSAGGLKTAEASTKFNRLDDEQKRLKEQIDQLERADDVYRETRGRTGPPPLGQVGGVVSPAETEDREYRDAFRAYLARGRGELSMQQRATLRHDRIEARDMGTGGEAAYPGATSGFFVPVGFQHKVEEALKYFGPMLNEDVVTLMDTGDGAPMPYPTSNDTAVMGELIGENQQVTMADVNVGMVMFGAWKLSTKLVKVSLELIEDSAFDIEAFLIDQFASRIGRAANSYLTTGLGSASSQPYGIVPATVVGGLSATAAGSYTNDGVGGGNTIGSDDLTTLEHLVDPLYRPGAKYMMSDPVLRSLKMIKDKYGRPLWMPGVRDKEPDTINGYEYAINPYMASLQTQASSPVVTNITMLFGAMKKYTVRRVRALSVLRLGERFADFGQVAFLGFYRFDGQLLDAGTHPVALLQNAY